ncbi:urea transporter 1-like [Labrus mixtus]|uniref:urea transporter 1-like n=1 Tax=Labrus mixtus TaxID=508554 RepID=UPI0029BFC675|nr:urea transporter 1-like [Labrus mixtus]XP_060917078.1 urea transporter 1-like [Labrus mixtus]
MDNNSQPSHDEGRVRSCFFSAVGLFTGDMRLCREWVKRQVLVIQLTDWIFRGVAQVMFVNNPLSGVLITCSLFLQNPWWALNGLLGTLISTVSAMLLGQNREAISAGLHGYNGTLVGMLMAVFSAKESWYWWLLLPNMFMSMLCPVVSSALSSVASKWDLPIFTLPFNILVCLHIAATGANHPFFPEVDIKPNHLHDSIQSLNISQLFLSVPVGVGQVYGCDSPWTGGLILLALLLSSPTICFHAMLGSAAGILSGLALAAPHKDIFSGLWGYNSALSCIAIGGVFYVLTWQTHLLAVICALFCAFMTAATSNLMSMLALPACTWPFCLSTLIFLLISSEIQDICRLPLSVVSYPEENRRYRRQLKALEKAQHCQQSSSQKEAQQRENSGPNVHLVVEMGCSE